LGRFGGGIGARCFVVRSWVWDSEARSVQLGAVSLEGASWELLAWKGPLVQEGCTGGGSTDEVSGTAADLVEVHENYWGKGHANGWCRMGGPAAEDGQCQDPHGG